MENVDIIPQDNNSPGIVMDILSFFVDKAVFVPFPHSVYDLA